MNFQIDLPEDQVEGHYADFASIWHNNETFILDFVATARPPELEQDGSGSPTSATVQCRVVTRVRVPGSQVWEVMKALEKQLTAWEVETGRQPSSPPEPEQEPPTWQP